MSRETRILRQLETALTATPDGLATRFGVGRRSILDSVAHLNSSLGPAASVCLEDGRYRLYIVDAQRYGAARERLLACEESLNDPSRRQALIFRRLLAATGTVRTEDLAEQLCVSRSTVAADLSALRATLAGDDVEVLGRTNSGVAVDGSELALRMAALTHFPAAICDDYPIDEEILACADQFAAGHHLNRSSRRTVLRWLTVLLDRFLSGHPLTGLPDEFQALAGTRAHQFAADLLRRVAPLVDTEPPQPEELFLAMAVMGMRTPDDPQGRQLFPVDEEIPELVDAIFARIEQTMGIRLDAEGLADEFAHHLNFMLNRMRFRISIDDDAIEDIRTEYPLAHRMAEVSRDVLQERTGLQVSDAEVGLIAGYLQVFLDSHESRHRGRLEVAVVTAGGRVSAQLMRIQLDKSLPADTRYRMLSVDDADDGSLAGADLVVTTPDVHLSAAAAGATPVIALRQVFDFQELAAQVSRLRLGGQGALDLAGANPSLLASLLSADRFLALPAGTGYWEATRALVARLESLGMVDDTFLPALAEREKGATMLLDELVGFPHATVAGTDRVVFAMAVMPQPAGAPGPRVVFLMGVPGKTDYDDTILVDVYDEIIRLAGDPHLLDQLSRLTSHEQLFWFLATHTPH